MDLAVQVLSWCSKGDIMIVLVDINKDICNNPIHSVFHQIGLVEAVTALHGNYSPNMHNQGQNPIDGIFIPLICFHPSKLGI